MTMNSNQSAGTAADDDDYQRILTRRLSSIAVAYGLPVRDNADLPELLDLLQGNQAIPVAAMAAVAEIMAQLKQPRHVAGMR